MKTLLKAVVGLFITVSAAQASVINWVSSPDANEISFGQTVVTGVNEINLNSSASQPIGIFGAGFTLTSKNVDVNFDSDLYSWDSYSPSTTAGTGYWDAFVVMISDVDYYWNLGGLSNPITADASTFVWGGDNYLDGILDNYTTAPGSGDTVSANSGAATQWYVSFVLDTKTPPADTNYPSWGSFHVDVPEPSTVLLLGAGLIGLSFAGSRKRKAS